MGIVGRDASWTFRRTYLRAAVVTAGLSAALATGVGLLVLLTLPRGTVGGTRTTLAIVAAIVVIVVVWLSFLWVRNIRVVVTDRHVDVWRPLVRLHSWDRSSTRFRVILTEDRTRTIRPARGRALVAIDPDGTTTAVTLTGFDGRTFAALVATLMPSAARSDRTPFDSQYPSTGASEFRIDVGELRGVVARRLTIAGGLIATLLAAGALHLLGPGVELDAVGFAIPAVGGASVAGMLAGAAATARTVHAIPEIVRVSSNGLELDGVAHAFDSLRSIQVAPSTYATKRIVLTDLTGRRTAFTLGTGTRMTPDYGQFVRALIESSAVTPGLVTFDLG